MREKDVNLRRKISDKIGDLMKKILTKLYSYNIIVKIYGYYNFIFFQAYV